MTQRITVDLDVSQVAKNLGGELAGVRLIDVGDHRQPCSCPIPGKPARVLGSGRPVAGFVLSPHAVVQLVFKEPVEVRDT